jgi:hypothetical protein
MEEKTGQKKELPVFLPQGWKKEVAIRIGVHPASMCRILKNKNSDSYRRVVKVAGELYNN